MYELTVSRSPEDGITSRVKLTFGRARVPMQIVVGSTNSEYELTAAECAPLHDLLRTLRISPAPAQGFLGLGSATTITFHHDLTEARYQWPMGAPQGWEPLEEIVSECYRLARTRHSSYAL